MLEAILCAGVLALALTVAWLLAAVSRHKARATELEGDLEAAEAKCRQVQQTMQQALLEARRPVVVAPSAPPPRRLPRAQPAAEGQRPDKRIVVEVSAPDATPWRMVIDRLGDAARMLVQASAGDDLRGLHGWNGHGDVRFAFGVAGPYPYPTLPTVREGATGTTRSETGASRALLPVEELIRKARLDELQANYLGGAFRQLAALREAAAGVGHAAGLPDHERRALLRALEACDLYLCKFVELVEPEASGAFAPPFDVDSGLLPAPGPQPLNELYQRLDGPAAGACPNSPLALAGDGAPPRVWRVDAAQAHPDGGHPLEPVYEARTPRAPITVPAAALHPVAAAG
ncbi:hypothetical protein [Coralloluteibacterium stylophorae]|uniref:Uncharacterized protein n=1 Tax=Coralloluteibacterium stylophorae TaxID=1776034 RepID=A0A8J8AYG4_9GAMM|nr:hypothetical protein [Coralloluteibacterium stylophorae]MBS7458106.1 hypothetical protein [Coralloluteibacterium stylophorae]